MVKAWVKHGLLACLVFVGLLPACATNSGGDWRIEPRKRIGRLLSTGSESELRRSYGSANVASTRIELGEGLSTVGTVLFPEDSVRRLEIIWQDSLHKEIPARVILRGPKSVWKLPGDISLGLSLLDLERRNGHPLTLAGFGWDYEGVVISWDGGAMDTMLTPDVKIYLRPEDGAQSKPEYARVPGDRPYSSSMPEMRALDPKIYQIFVDFGHLPSPGESEHAPAYEIHEEDNGKAFRYEETTRFAVILDERTHPHGTLHVDPRGIVGEVSDVPDAKPPLYATVFEAARPGTCRLVAKGFSVRIDVVPKPEEGAKSDTAASRGDTSSVNTAP